MAQRNRDIEQDVNDILATRDELTEKVELLRGRIRGQLWQTKHEIGRSIDQVKETVTGVGRIFNPSYQLRGHPVAMVALIITVRYLLRQLRKTDARRPAQRSAARWTQKMRVPGRLR